jgi:hypothetical protein
MNKRKIIIAIIFAIIAIVGALIYQIYTAIDRSGKIPVEVAAAPNDAKITFKDKKTKAEYTAKNGTNYLPPGDYSITAAKDGFRSSQTEVNATTKPRYTVFVFVIEGFGVGLTQVKCAAAASLECCFKYYGSLFRC